MPAREGPHTGCVPPVCATGCPDWVPEGEVFVSADRSRTARLIDEAIAALASDVVEVRLHPRTAEPGDWGPAERTIAALGLLSEAEIRQVCGALRDAGLLRDPDGVSWGRRG